MHQKCSSARIRCKCLEFQRDPRSAELKVDELRYALAAVFEFFEWSAKHCYSTRQVLSVETPKLAISALAFCRWAGRLELALLLRAQLGSSIP